MNITERHRVYKQSDSFHRLIQVDLHVQEFLRTTNNNNYTNIRFAQRIATTKTVQTFSDYTKRKNKKYKN